MDVDARDRLIAEKDARIAALEIELERRADELDALKESLGMRWLPPAELRLTGKEGMMLGRLLVGGVISKEQFLAALYRNQGIVDEPEIKIIDVFMCKMRRKLKLHGVKIETIWGVGYEMPKDQIAKFYGQWPPSPLAA